MNTNINLISLENISYTIPTVDGMKPILQDVNLHIQRGEWVAIVGSNGSGKSTLAKVMAKLNPISAGKVTYHIDETPPVQLIFQNPESQMVGETVYEDVCFGMLNYGVDSNLMDARAKEALARVGLADCNDWKTSQLSGGQQQLLAIAGCLAVNPALLILDEATSMLDPLSRQNIIKVLSELHRQGRTVVWITQILDELAWCDRVIALEDGEIVYNGSKHDFFYDPINPAAPSVCEQLGFIAPYTVQVVHSLIRQGVPLHSLPLTPEDLATAISSRLRESQ
jgi:energy-coupling factor transport system ATP-binding protein